MLILCVVRNPDRRRTRGQERAPPIAVRARAPAPARLAPRRSDMREGIKVEPVREGPRHRLRPFDRKAHALGFDEAHVAAPPGDQRGERRAHADRLGKARVLMAERGLGLFQQHEARPMAANLEPHHQRIFGKRREVDAPLHVAQQRFEIDILLGRFARQPALAPGGERAHQRSQFAAGFGELIFRPVRAVGARDRADVEECLQPLGKHRARHPRNAAADIVEAAAAGQEFAHDQQRPAAAQRFVGARHRAVLSVSGHVGSLARRAGQCGRIPDRGARSNDP